MSPRKRLLQQIYSSLRWVVLQPRPNYLRFSKSCIHWLYLTFVHDYPEESKDTQTLKCTTALVIALLSSLIKLAKWGWFSDRPAKSSTLHGDDGLLQFRLTDPICIPIDHRKTAHVNRERRVLWCFCSPSCLIYDSSSVAALWSVLQSVPNHQL